jgi:hypothetical protein
MSVPTRITAAVRISELTARVAALEKSLALEQKIAEAMGRTLDKLTRLTDQLGRNDLQLLNHGTSTRKQLRHFELAARRALGELSKRCRSTYTEKPSRN